MSSTPLPELRPLPPPAALSVLSFDGTEIRFDVYEQSSRGLVVVIPGFWRDRRHPSMKRLAALLHGFGYRVAVLDVRGHGESGGIYGFNLHEHHDVAAVVQRLLEGSSTESVTLLGLSYGAAIAISATARHQLPIDSLLLVSAVADFAMITPRLNIFTLHRHIAFRQAFRRPRFDWRMKRSAKLRALDDVANVRVPLSFIHVKDDWLIGHTHSETLFRLANEPKELHILEIRGNYHADRIFSVAQKEIEPLIGDFLRRHTRR